MRVIRDRIPDIISGFRLIAAPFLLCLGWMGYRDFFLILLSVSLLSDSIDGFIASVASMLAVKINSQVSAWLFYAHRSDEKGHKMVLDHLDVQPILDLKMRLGEGSGAAVAVPILRSACALHNEMATFAQARVSTGSG